MCGSLVIFGAVFSRRFQPPLFGVSFTSLMEMLTMLIQIEEGTHGANWVVKLDNYPVKCRSWDEAREFADKMTSRINAPHPLPGRFTSSSVNQTAAPGR
jgi:formylglycine-generating enzyme required for sulfatase activity